MKNALLIRISSVALALILAGCLTTHADNETWTSSSNGAWSIGSNWAGGAAPGSTTGTNNSDTATFNSSTGVTVTIDQTGQNIGSIVFGFGAGVYSIGNASGNSLLLSSGGSITDSIMDAYFYPSMPETINAPLVLEPASSTTAGVYSFTNAAVNISDVYAPSSGFFLNIAGNVSGGTTSSTITLNLNGMNTGYTTVNDNTVSGVISDGNAAGGLGITKSGTGTWLLTNANTYSGITTINGGTLGTSQLANGSVASGIGMSGSGAANLLINGGTLQYTGSGASTDRLFTVNGTSAGATATLDASGSGAVNFSNTGSVAYGTANQTRTLILTGTNTNNNTLAALVADNGTGATSLTKSGPGTWALTNQDTYTGATTVTGGTLSFGGGFINSSSALVLGGGTLSLTTAGSSTQAFNGTTIASGASAVSAAAGETITLGNTTRNVGGTVDFSSTGTITITGSITTHGVLGYATFGGTTWAVAPLLNGHTSTGPIKGVASADYYPTTFGGNTAWNYSSNSIVDVNSSPVLSAGVTVNSLRFNAGAPETLTLQGTNTITTGGILVTSNVGNNVSIITGGILQGAYNADLVVIQNGLYFYPFKSVFNGFTLDTTGALTINSVIADNGTSSGLTKSGSGMLVLGGNNTYTGTTTLNAGTLVVNNSSSLGSALTINGGTFVGSGSVGVLNGTGGTIVDYGYLNIGANNASGSYAGSITHLIPFYGIVLTKVGIGTETFTGTIASAGQLNIYGGTIAVGAGGSIDFGQGINLLNSGTTLDISAGGNQSISLTGVAGSTVNLGGNTLSVYAPSFAGVIKGSGGSLDLVGTSSLTGVNTYSGQTVIDAATLAIGAGGSIAASSGVNLANSSAIFDISAGGNQTIQDLTGVAGSTVNLGSKTLTAGTANSTLFAGEIHGGGGLTKQGTGALTLTGGANTYSGQTVILAGTLAIAGPGSIASSSVVNLANSGTTFDISAAGYQTIQDLTGVAGSSVNLGANTLTAGTANSTLFAGVIQGGGGLTKQGAGALTLSGANTYSGGTSVTGGTLYANGGSADPSSATGTSAVSVGPGAALGGSGVIRPTVSGAGIILAGTGTTTSAVATLISGGAQPAIGANGANTAVAGSGLTLDNRTAQGVILNAAVLSAGLPTANLTFYLGAGTTGLNGSTIGQTPFDFANPNTGSTYMNVPGSTPGELAFVSGDTITVIDLTGGNLQLNLDVPYLLIQADSNADYSGLVTNTGTDINGNALNGFVTNLTLTTGTGTAAGEYYDTRLYLYNGDLEIVPEPGTWVMMFGGLAVLMFCQLRQYRKLS